MDMPEEKAVLEMLNVAVGLCQRNSSKEKKDNQMWFQILDRMVAPSIQPRSGTRARQTVMVSAKSGSGLNIPAAKLKQTFNFLMREVLRQMMT